MAISKCCLTASGDPGTFNMIVFPLIQPQQPLDKDANGCFIIVSVHIVNGIDGINIGFNDMVASGVTSRELNPVPPLVIIKLYFELLPTSCVHSLRVFTISAFSSGTIYDKG